MEPDTQPKVCLDVAVDHRIRRLFKPISDCLTECSNHVARIETRGLTLKRSHSEVQITAQLAGPEIKGGIAVVLQQPRHNHPFEKGLDAVIQNCESLYALDDIFSTVSCRSLNIRTNVTVVDLLPYISEGLTRIDATTLEESFRASKHIILDKEPSVLLCAGRIWLPSASMLYKRKGDACKLESIGVGQKFGKTPKYPVKVRIHHEGKRGFVTISRVNGFHPSHAMNYYPHVSRLRQLQILIGAETCGMLRGDWEEKDWMGELRYRCQNFSQAPSDSPIQSSGPQSPHESPTRRSTAKYLPDYQKLYSDKLLRIRNCVMSLILKPIPTKKLSIALYKPLLSSGLSELCNDATLILRQMSRLRHKGWPSSVAWKNEAALKEAAIDTVGFAKNLLEAIEPGKHMKIAEIIQKEASLLLHSVTSGSGTRFEYDLDFNKARDAFLKMATDIETLLMGLLQEEEKVLYTLGQEDLLSSKMEMMTLASAVNRAAPLL